MATETPSTTKDPIKPEAEYEKKLEALKNRYEKGSVPNRPGEGI